MQFNATMTRCLILILLASHLSVLSAMTTNNRILLSSLLVGSALGLSVCKYLAVFDFTSPNDLLHIQKVLHFILQSCRWARRKNNLNNIWYWIDLLSSPIAFLNLIFFMNSFHTCNIFITEKKLHLHSINQKSELYDTIWWLIS